MSDNTSPPAAPSGTPTEVAGGTPPEAAAERASLDRKTRKAFQVL